MRCSRRYHPTGADDIRGHHHHLILTIRDGETALFICFLRVLKESCNEVAEISCYAEEEILEAALYNVGQVGLVLVRQQRDVGVLLEEVEELRRVGHPERQSGGGVASLLNALTHKEDTAIPTMK